MKIKQRITVKFSYDIHFTHDLFAPDNAILQDVIGSDQSKIFVFLDTGVATSWPGLEHNIGEWFDIYPRCGLLVSPVILVPGGERCKKILNILK